MILVAPIEYKLLTAAARRRSLKDVAAELGVRQEDLMRFVESLRAKGLLSVERLSAEGYALTEEGVRYAAEGLPELAALKSAKCGDGCEIEIPRGPEGRILLANLARYGLRPRGEGRIVAARAELEKALGEAERRQRLLEALAHGEEVPEDIAAEFLRRKLVKRIARTEIYVQALVDPSQLKVAELKTALTEEDLKTGAWRNYILKPFDLRVEVPAAPAPVPHFFQKFLAYVREVMVGLSFEEVRGPVVELEFWNFDALFQAQDHPAREVHDTFFVKWTGEVERPPEELMARVGEEHERGWGYEWDQKKALGLVLRSQTTATTIRALAERGDGSYKVFTIGRVFRPEHIDPKHNVEFHQLDGIVVGPRLTFKHLLGQLEQIAKALGMEEVAFKPAYFPFTSPSVEVYARHRALGWIEFGGAGIFRPEVTRPLGVERSRVLAWGWGLDRVAMILLGIDDIRELFTMDLAKLEAYYKRWQEFKKGVGLRGTRFTL